MRRVLDVVRAILLSPEFVFAAGLALIVSLKSEIFISLASMVTSVDERINYLALISPAIVAVLIKQKDDLLFVSGHPMAGALQEWPQYHLILDRYWVTIMWCVLCSIITISIWILDGDLSHYIIFSLFFGSIIISLIASLTFFSATITLRRILSTMPKRHATNK